jgi:acyl-CoA thioester hydrolase
MNEIHLPFKHLVRVYYEDTDVGQVVYHANYIKYMERARTEWLRSLSVDQSILIEQNIAFAVVNIGIDYIKPARFNDELVVSSDVVKVGRASIVFEQEIRLQSNPESLLCKAIVKVACVSMPEIKSRALPQELLQILRGRKQ